MSFTMYGRSLLLRGVFTPGAITMPTTLQLALTTTVPPANAVSSQLVEPTAAGYARQTIPLDAMSWAPNGFGDIYSAVKLHFPTVEGAWGLLVGWALIDPVSEQCVAAGRLMNPTPAVVGSQPYVDAGALVLTISD